jgi:Protein of unknown function (DUF4239)
MTLPTAKILRISFPLFAVSILSALLVVFVRPYIKYEGLIQDVSAWGAFFTVFGVIYAIVAGFLLVTVLSRYSALSQTVEDELNAVESIRDFLVYFGSDQQPSAQRIRNSLAEYTNAIATIEWKEMSDPATPTNSDTSQELYEIMRRTAEMPLTGERDNSVMSAVIANIADLAKMRTRRIALANDRLPPRLRLLLLLMSVALAVGYYGVGVQSLVAHIFMVSALSVSVYLLFWIIEDLDHPFYGIWTLTGLLLTN